MPGRRFFVAFTLAGEQLEFARALRDALVREGVAPERIFFYPDRQAELAGQNGAEVLSKVYREHSELVVPFLSSEYSEKEWTQFEWDQVLDLALKRERKRLFPLRFPGFDPSRLAAFSRTTFYVEIEDTTTPESVAHDIVKRLAELGIHLHQASEQASAPRDHVAILYASDGERLKERIAKRLKDKKKAGLLAQVVSVKVDQQASLARRRLSAARKCGTILVLGTEGLANTTCGVPELVRAASHAGSVLALFLVSAFDVDLLSPEMVDYVAPDDGRYLDELSDAQKKKVICEVLDKLYPRHEDAPPYLQILRRLLRRKGVDEAIRRWRGQFGSSAEDVIRDGPFDLILIERLVNSLKVECKLSQPEAIDLAYALLEAMLPLWEVSLPERGFLGAELVEASRFRRPVRFEKEQAAAIVRGASAYEMLPPRGFGDAAEWARQFRFDLEKDAPEIAQALFERVLGEAAAPDRRRDLFLREVKKYKAELALRARMKEPIDDLDPPPYLLVRTDADPRELIEKLQAELDMAGVYDATSDESHGDPVALEVESSFLELAAMRVAEEEAQR